MSEVKETVTAISDTVSKIVRSRTCGCKDIHIALIKENTSTQYVAGIPQKLARAIKIKVDEKWTSEKVYSDDETEEVITSYEGTDVEPELQLTVKRKNNGTETVDILEQDRDYTITWQKNQNAEIGVDINVARTRISLVGYFNRTKMPYKYTSTYTPFAYNVLQLPEGFELSANPQITVDNQTGMGYIRDDENSYWTPLDVKVKDQTFVRSTSPDNGPDITRRGAEMIIDFPEITPLRTQFRVDAAYTYTKYIDNSLSYYYQNGWSHTSLANRSYQYVGIYANGDNSSTTANGKRTHSLDANITAITRIPKARLIISCKLEASLIKRSQNLSEYNGTSYAFNVSENSNEKTGGSIYDGNSYTAIYPVAYLDLNNEVHPFTAAEAENPDFAHLIRKSGNAYTFAADGYDPYFSANISITKEIGDHVSLSFNAINFTNSRAYVKSYATGTSAIFTPNFYYGLTCRIKL